MIIEWCTSDELSEEEQQKRLDQIYALVFEAVHKQYYIKGTWELKNDSKS